MQKYKIIKNLFLLQIETVQTLLTKKIDSQTSNSKITVDVIPLNNFLRNKQERTTFFFLNKLFFNQLY